MNVEWLPGLMVSRTRSIKLPEVFREVTGTVCEVEVGDDPVVLMYDAGLTCWDMETHKVIWGSTAPELFSSLQEARQFVERSLENVVGVTF